MMRRVDWIELISLLFDYKTIFDKQGNEYVLFKNNKLNEIENIVEDKTAFEAIENHIHILKNVKKKEFKRLVKNSKYIGKAVFNSLSIAYPDKQFVVYITVKLNDSMIIRFHQKWHDEPEYFDADSFVSNRQKLFVFKRD